MTEQRKLLSTKEAAEYCGFKLSYFRKLMMRRVIPMYKPRAANCVSSRKRIWTLSLQVSASPPKRKLRRKPTAILQAGSKSPFYSHQKQMQLWNRLRTWNKPEQFR